MKQCDTIKFLRYASFYLKKLRQLPDQFPETYNHFENGEFVVKGKPGTFNAVSKGLQRSKKNQSSIIGQTRQNNYLTEWELVYHEILVIYFMV